MISAPKVIHGETAARHSADVEIMGHPDKPGDDNRKYRDAA
jgi:hypothetical protein